MTDPLTIAFLALGTEAAHDTCAPKDYAIPDVFGGWCGFVESVVQFADLIDEYWDSDNPHDGVWSYDIVQPMGLKIGAYMIEFGDTPVEAWVRNEIEGLLKFYIAAHDETKAA